MFKKFLIISIFLLAALAARPGRAAAPANVYFFWLKGCPHCAAEEKFFDQLLSQEPYRSSVTINRYEVSEKDSLELLKKIAERLDFKVDRVPVTVIGKKYFIGFDSDVGKGTQIKSALDEILAGGQTDDPIADLLKPAKPAPVANDQLGDYRLKTFWGSELELKKLSLPALATAIGLVDGFNPCAMWTLLFLISLLLGMKDRKRMWFFGAVFIIGSAAVYFIFMAAWLNLILFLGMILAIRVLIGLAAVGGGIWSIRKFWRERDDGCEVVGQEKRRRVFDKIKQVVHKKSFWLALLGVLALAFAVNLVELLCSAGLPAVFTQILALNDLTAWQRYGYIIWYLFFYMLDDLIIFIVAMVSLKSFALSTKYGRWSGLIGGILMLVIGILLIFKYEWLTFG